MNLRLPVLSSIGILTILFTVLSSISDCAATPSPTQGGRPFWPRFGNNNDNSNKFVTISFGETKRGLVAGPTRLEIEIKQRPDGIWMGQEPLGEGLYKINGAAIEKAPRDTVCFLVWYREYNPDFGYLARDLAYLPITTEQPVTETVDRVSYVLCTPKFGGLGG